jgi:hypothetical protein
MWQDYRDEWSNWIFYRLAFMILMAISVAFTQYNPTIETVLMFGLQYLYYITFIKAEPYQSEEGNLLEKYAVQAQLLAIILLHMSAQFQSVFFQNGSMASLSDLIIPGLTALILLPIMLYYNLYAFFKVFAAICGCSCCGLFKKAKTVKE